MHGAEVIFRDVFGQSDLFGVEMDGVIDDVIDWFGEKGWFAIMNAPNNASYFFIAQGHFYQLANLKFLGIFVGDCVS